MQVVPYTEPTNYGEMPQHNPLRWTLLYKDGEIFHEQSGKFMCKDFFNDLVAAYRGLVFREYGFDFTTVKLNVEGVYVMLSGLVHREQLMDNLGSINIKAAEQSLPAVEILEVVDDETQLPIFIPREYFRNTYHISLLTYYIRIAHTSFVGSYEELTTDVNPAWRVDRPFRESESQILPRAFQMPLKAVEDWPYCFYPTKERNEKASKREQNAIHNNGVKNWWEGIQRMDIKELVEETV